MKILLTIILVSVCLVGLGQARIENDTLYYADQKYWEDKEVQLWYGSTGDKSFAFVYSLMGGKLPASWAKTKAKITKIYKTDGTYYIMCKPERGGRLIISVEGAIDTQELKTEKGQNDD